VELSSDIKDKQRYFIRAHPDFRQTGLWFDWVVIRWDSELNSAHNILIPDQVLMVLDFDSIVYEDIVAASITKLLDHLPREQNIIEEEKRNGIHLLVHSASDDNTRDFDIHHDSIVHRYVMEPFFQLAMVDSRLWKREEVNG
jgi:hypothetical protein